MQRSRARSGALVSVVASLLLGLILALTPRAVLAAEYDVEVDACALLADADIEALTEWTDFTTDGGRSSRSESSCFWGSVVGGEPGYVELRVSRQSSLDSASPFGDDCLATPVTDVGEDAVFAECPTDVWMYAYELGAAVSLQVDQPAVPLGPDELSEIVRSVFAQLELVDGAAPSPGSAPTVCLPEEIESAIDSYIRLDPVAEPPPDDVAAALAALDLSGSAAEARDGLVSALSSDPPDEMSLTLGANRFRAEVRIDCPVPPAGSPLADWSPDGVSTYEGTWTVVAYAFDGEGTPEYEVGDSVPGTLTVDCSAVDGFCGLEGTFDGEQGVALSLVVVSDGVARYENRDALANCDGGQTLTRTLDLEFGAEAASATDAFVYDPRTCDDGEGSTLFSTDITWSFSGSLVAYTPPAGAVPSGEATPASPGAEAPTPVEPVDEGSAVGNESAVPFAASVPAPSEVSTDPIVVLQSAALAALLVFLMPFPSQLFNSTLETHEDEVRRWFRLDRMGAVVGGIGAFWASWPGLALFTLLAALLYGFLDPGFGFDLGSLATFLGMLLGIVLVTAAFAIPLVLAHRRHGDRPSLKVVPVSLLVGVACVLLSRLTDFQPGYLYGLLIGLAFARELSAAEEGRATAVGAALMLGVAFVSWIGLGALPDGDGFGIVVGRTAMAALMVAGLEGVVFGLLPMRFLPGEPLYRWNRVLWAGLLLVGAFAFFHILINPASGYLSDTSRTPLFTVVALLLGFSLISVAFWAWFRFRPDQPSAADPTN